MCSAVATPEAHHDISTSAASPAETESHNHDEAHEAAMGFNLLTSLGLRSYHRLWHGGSTSAVLSRLLQAYVDAGSYSEACPDGDIFDVAVIHCDTTSGRDEVMGCLSEDGRLPFGAVLVAVWQTSQGLGEHRNRWVDAALARGRSVELLTLGRRYWAVFRSIEGRLMSAAGLGLATSPGPMRGAGMPNPMQDGVQAPEGAGEADLPAHSERLDQEIARYRDCVNVHDLPEIYHFWSHRYVRPKLVACGYNDVDDVFFQHLMDVAQRDPQTRHRVASIGAGNCDLEVKLAVMLREAGIDNLLFHCLELNPHMIERGRELAQQEGVEDRFEFDVMDIDTWDPQEPHGACIANHSLHHIVELEMLFEKIHRAIGEHGVFLTNDMIGRNGHMRWPEALVHVEDIWSSMPQRYKYNHQLARWEDEFDNWDCSKEGNEGIRAEDILPLLLESFHFESFMAFGNIIDIFVDRSFGHNFDHESQEDLDFIERIAELDEAKLNSGEVKPTHIVAAMRTRPVEEPRVYEHWTPEFCVRYPDSRRS